MFSYNLGEAHFSDMDQYYLDLDRANEKGVAEWKLLYKLSETYAVPDLSVGSMEKVLNQLQGNADVFRTYYRYNTLGHEEGRSFKK